MDFFFKWHLPSRRLPFDKREHEKPRLWTNQLINGQIVDAAHYVSWHAFTLSIQRRSIKLCAYIIFV